MPISGDLKYERFRPRSGVMEVVCANRFLDGLVNSVPDHGPSPRPSVSVLMTGGDTSQMRVLNKGTITGTTHIDAKTAQKAIVRTGGAGAVDLGFAPARISSSRLTSPAIAYQM